MIKESQIEEVEVQWAIANGTYDDLIAEKQRFETERAELQRKFGSDASDADVKWSLFQKQLIENAQNYDWGLYRNTLLDMGEFLWNESRWDEALKKYLEVCYLDLNGPMNSADPQLADEYPAFNLKFAVLAPAVVSGVQMLADSVDLESKSLKDRFIDAARVHHKALRLPRSPLAAWQILEKELDRQSNPA